MDECMSDMKGLDIASHIKTLFCADVAPAILVLTANSAQRREETKQSVY